MSNDYSEAVEQDNVQHFRNLLKKTKRKSMLRNIIISVLSAMVVIVGLLIADKMLLSRSANKALSDLYHYQLISSPNVLLGESQSLDSVLGGTAIYRTYKIIEGIPLPWDEEKIHYNVFGQYGPFVGGHSPLNVKDPDMEKLNMARPYNVMNGQRELMFFHPEVHYPDLLNELNKLDQIDSGKKVEMAISLDHAYTANEIRDMLPSGVHARWFWVDTYTPEYIKFMNGPPALPLISPNVYGFAAYADPEDTRENDEGKFIEYVNEGLKQNGNYDWEYTQIFNQLRGAKKEPAKDDVHPIGVVVTGSPETLRALQGKSYVRAVVLGAIAEKY
ncbi:anti sigma factor C-terminal domain-containing protein [Paenibacillus sp. VCA1]|uniref:anti sigma factor C-terminal domain-containing protein n=1 Tax=Paenibacillus sp. VCA1 TaxID=3039148 RepID=UPI0028726E3C|nr:anti sigma factor C-terminal domain-containing protein [Paenibacillus sp. VCA1]MDR9852682.1 anti sigma factor C-terminal domain-containing protein [Paenibacillus sp. VCA1]